MCSYKNESLDMYRLNNRNIIMTNSLICIPHLQSHYKGGGGTQEVAVLTVCKP